MPMPVKVKKWGSSMAVLIPSQFAKMHKIDLGTMIDLESVRVVKSKRRRYKLAELRSRSTMIVGARFYACKAKAGSGDYLISEFRFRINQ